MGYWNSRGLRGSVLEELINMTNELYRREGVALIQKIPTPIKPVDFDSEKKMIRLAYFEQKRYGGLYWSHAGDTAVFRRQGDRKEEPALLQYPRASGEIHGGFYSQGGLAFLLVHFSIQDEYFLLPFETLEEYFQGGSRKSTPMRLLSHSMQIPYDAGGCLHYLKAALKYYQNQRKNL